MHKLPSMIRQLRPHQWVKNFLIFVPLIAGHQLANSAMLYASFKAFIAFSLTASAIYIMNDLFDLEADRAHPRKSARPLAAGEIAVSSAIAVALILALGGFTLMMGVSDRATALLGLYVLLNVGYSRFLKEVAIVDVLLLASFYTVRILIGGAAADIVLTPWLLAFSMFIFFSLALAKRVSELQTMDGSRHSRRGYRIGDLEVLMVMGACAGQLAVLVFALYINSEDMVRLYRRPEVLWYLCIAIFYWNTRIWLSVHRTEMNEDPIVFALKDRGSYVVLAIGAIILYLATGSSAQAAERSINIVPENGDHCFAVFDDAKLQEREVRGLISLLASDPHRDAFIPEPRAISESSFNLGIARKKLRKVADTPVPAEARKFKSRLLELLKLRITLLERQDQFYRSRKVSALQQKIGNRDPKQACPEVLREIPVAKDEARLF